eukprot:g14895.t1
MEPVVGLIELPEPEWLTCPLTGVMFREPVVNLFGNTYEREMYSKALQHRLVDPLTNLPLPEPDGGALHPNRAVPPAPNASRLASSEQRSFWENLEKKDRQSAQGCARMAAGALFSLRSVLPEYEPRDETSRQVHRVGSILGMCAGLSFGRFGWALGVRLVRALAGELALAPVALLAQPESRLVDWLRLTMPLPLNWAHVIGAQLFFGRFFLVRLLIKEAIFAKLPVSIYYAAKLCRQDVTSGGEALPDAVAGICSCPSLSLWAAFGGTARLLPLLGAMYGFTALMVRASAFTAGSVHHAVQLRAARDQLAPVLLRVARRRLEELRARRGRGGVAPRGARKESCERVRPGCVVALQNTDVLVLDPSLLDEGQQDPVAIPSCATTDATCPATGIKEIYQLSRLLRQSEAFQSLESRSLRQLCRGLRCRSFHAGELVCAEGEAAHGFFQILQGQASSSARGASLLPLKEGSAVGEDVLLGEERWPYSVVAESELRILWVDAQLFKETCLDLSGEKAARRRVVEARRRPGRSRDRSR